MKILVTPWSNLTRQEKSKKRNELKRKTAKQEKSKKGNELKKDMNRWAEMTR